MLVAWKCQTIKKEISGVSKEIQKLKGSIDQLNYAYDLHRKMKGIKTETQYDANSIARKLELQKKNENTHWRIMEYT